MKFHKDPNNPEEMICDDCYQALEEINSEWMDIDEDDTEFGREWGDWDEEEDEEDE